MAEIIDFSSKTIVGTVENPLAIRAKKIGTKTLFHKALQAVTILQYYKNASEAFEVISHWHTLNLLTDEEVDALYIFYGSKT